MPKPTSSRPIWRCWASNPASSRSRSTTAASGIAYVSAPSRAFPGSMRYAPNSRTTISNRWSSKPINVHSYVPPCECAGGAIHVLPRHHQPLPDSRFPTPRLKTACITQGIHHHQERTHDQQPNRQPFVQRLRNEQTGNPQSAQKDTAMQHAPCKVFVDAVPVFLRFECPGDAYPIKPVRRDFLEQQRQAEECEKHGETEQQCRQ